MKNCSGGAAPENAKAFLGDFAATGGIDFELIRLVPPKKGFIERVLT
jgi:hypothetical protein